MSLLLCGVLTAAVEEGHKTQPCRSVCEGGYSPSTLSCSVSPLLSFPSFLHPCIPLSHFSPFHFLLINFLSFPCSLIHILSFSLVSYHFSYHVFFFLASLHIRIYIAIIHTLSPMHLQPFPPLVPFFFPPLSTFYFPSLPSIYTFQFSCIPPSVFSKNFPSFSPSPSPSLLSFVYQPYLPLLTFHVASPLVLSSLASFPISLLSLISPTSPSIPSPRTLLLRLLSHLSPVSLPSLFSYNISLHSFIRYGLRILNSSL